MFDLSFIEWLQIGLSFLVGGIVVAGVTYVSEKFSDRLGGLIAGMPYPIMIALFFQALVIGTEKTAIEVTPPALVSLALIGVFFLAYDKALKLGFVKALLIATLAWFCSAYLIDLINVTSIMVAGILSILIAIAVRFAYGSMKSAGKPSTKTDQGLWIRFLFGGSFVATAVLASVLIGPEWGGLLTSYPSLATSALIVLNITAGAEFTRGFANRFFSSAMINCFLFIVAVYYLYPIFGVWLGTLLAYIFPMISVIILYQFDKKSQKAVKAAS